MRLRDVRTVRRAATGRYLVALVNVGISAACPATDVAPSGSALTIVVEASKVLTTLDTSESRHRHGQHHRRHDQRHRDQQDYALHKRHLLHYATPHWVAL